MHLSARARAAKFAGVGQGRCQVRTAIMVPVLRDLHTTIGISG
eukprot:SAG25_NODE_6026_length_595_cov_1.872984_1_plen_42_part_10